MNTTTTTIRLLLSAALAPAMLTTTGCPREKPDTGCSSSGEIPYDGIDQDCDGSDLTDADSDGFDATLAGGDDCDDSDATVHPGSTETWYDGTDQDCDGRVDEYFACGDGTGEFTALQEAIDTVPDDSVIELCPGTYTEDVVIEDRRLSIEGAGEMPEDVVVVAATADRNTPAIPFLRCRRSPRLPPRLQRRRRDLLGHQLLRHPPLHEPDRGSHLCP